MPSEPSPRRRRLHVLIFIAGIALAVLVGIGIYGLIVGPRQPGPPSATVTTAPPPSEQPEPDRIPPSWEQLPPLPHTTDPVVYASAVAEALLTWDTMSGLAPSDYTRPVIADADLSGYETPGLASDVANYLPTAEVWQELRQYATSQSVTIDAAFVPDSWETVAASAGGQLREGTVAVTIEATRHRSGEWFDRPATSDHPVSFTVFVACEPAFDRCHGLRLSQLDNPLR